MRSMTGFGEKRFSAPGFRGKISVKSLNHRFFDWNYKGTPLGDLENRFRARAQKKLLRGRIEVAIELDFLDPARWEIIINETLLGKILTSMEKASRRLGKSFSFSVDNILRVPQVVEIRRRELTPATRSFLEKAFDNTLEQVLRARRREGREIVRQIQRHLRAMKKSLRRVENLARTQPRVIRAKLAQRLKELNGNLPVEEERIAGELAYLVQKADIGEEIMRLRSHIGAFEEWLEAEREEPVGKRLDFLSQEIVREANTINSKSQNIVITRESLAIKSEVETIRQHVQNIE
jgi:uncharacterized protein (TIGR00255 family)